MCAAANRGDTVGGRKKEGDYRGRSGLRKDVSHCSAPSGLKNAESQGAVI